MAKKRKQHKIFCMMTSGLPLSEFAMDALYRTAKQMARNNKKEHSLISDDAEGKVTTNFEICLFARIFHSGKEKEFYEYYPSDD